MRSQNIFIAEPYRVFFPLGWLACVVGVTYWLLLTWGYPIGYNPTYHALIQIQLFCGAFVVGFLLTALPKFLGTPAASTKEFVFFLITYSILSLALLSGSIFLSQIIFVIFMLQLILFGVLRVSIRKSAPPTSFYIVPFGILLGLVGSLLTIWPSQTFPQLGQKLLNQGMLLSLVLGVGSFLGPRLMGVVDTSNIVVSFSKVPNSIPIHKDPRIIVVLLGLLISVSFFIETGYDRELGLYIRSLASLFFFYYFGIFKRPRSQSIIGVLVAISLWSMVSGLCLATVFPQYEVALLHIKYIGGFGFLILVIGAQVITSHGKVPRFWHLYKIHSIFITLLVFSSIIFRVLASTGDGINFKFIFIASLLFDFALILWGLGVFRYITNK